VPGPDLSIKLRHETNINAIIRVTSSIERPWMLPSSPRSGGGTDGTASLGLRGLRAASGRTEIVTFLTAFTLVQINFILIRLLRVMEIISDSVLHNFGVARHIPDFNFFLRKPS
jgi:hypothetical protein